jgi:hypothetical protein
MITAERVREVLDYDPETGVFTRKVRLAHRHQVGDIAGQKHTKGYVLIGVDSELYFAHRLAWLHYYGEWPKNQIDHINRVKTDNRIANLRDVTNAENHRNRPINSNNKSGHIGVSWAARTGRWQATITVAGKSIFLGQYDKLEDAIAARKAAEAEHGYRSAA